MEPQNIFDRIYQALNGGGGDLPSDWVDFRAWPPVPTDWADGGRGFGGHAVGHRDHHRTGGRKRGGIATFVDDPSTATTAYLITTPPSQMAMDGVGFVLTFLPAGAGATTGTVMRPALRDAAWALRHHLGEFLDSIAARIRWQLRHADEDIGPIVVRSKRLPGDPASGGWASTQRYRTTSSAPAPNCRCRIL